MVSPAGNETRGDGLRGAVGHDRRLLRYLMGAHIPCIRLPSSAAGEPPPAEANATARRWPCQAALRIVERYDWRAVAKLKLFLR
jgi:hypothetical protein